MADPADAAPSKGRLFVINLIGAIGLVFGFLPIVKYLLELTFLDFAAAPYAWLQLEGGIRFVPPAMVLAICFVVAWWLERRATAWSR